MKYLLNGSCKNQIDIYRECYYELNIPWFWSFSKVLETIGRSRIGLKFLGSVLIPFLYKGLSFATLQSFGKWDSLMDKLQICIMGMANPLTPFFKNLPHTQGSYRACFPVFWTFSYFPVFLSVFHCLASFFRLFMKFQWTILFLTL